MGRPRRVNCRVCGRHVDECGPLSARGLCEDDSIGRIVANQQQMIAQRGEFYDRWVVGVLAHAAPALDRAAAQQQHSDPDGDGDGAGDRQKPARRIGH